LDKARALLYPLKKKYGDALSWGDLFILAGTTAYRQAGAPISRMCFGRIDQLDGAESMTLNDPCTSQGNCDEPWGATTVGLIYVNPAGVLVDGEIVSDPALSAVEIRRTFGTMGHTDTGTVALIGGGHTVGKAHGACPDGAGYPPAFAFQEGVEIWKGACGTGVGADAVTSGFEGYWTTNPYTWDNEYFTQLVEKNWTLWTGPGGNPQWKTEDSNNMMLTTDLALMEDDTYREIVQSFAADQSAFDAAFDEAWYILTTGNVGGEWSSSAKCDDGSTPEVKARAKLRKDEGPSMVV